MQNNVTELTQRLLRALDSNYNVIDMPEVVDIISLLEKVAITKELLETTRLGKHVNELRRKTSDTELCRRAKELVKKWRSMVLPEANGQIAQPNPAAGQRSTTPNKISPPLKPRASPVPPKVSPPVPSQKMVQSRLVSPGVQRLVSPGVQRRLVSPHGKMVSPGLQVHKLVSPHGKTSPGLQAALVSPGVRRVSPVLATQAQGQVLGGVSPPLSTGQNTDINLSQTKSRKRAATNDGLENVNAKRSRLNGGVTDLEFSDSSNSSFKDVISSSTATAKPSDTLKRDVIVINSDSNSSVPDKSNALNVDDQIPKKRGRKKGSKNYKNLLDDAETSFSNKLAVSASRGGSKVKTTQEILAGIQNKNSVAVLSAAAGLKPSKEDLEEKAAKLTERVSIIDRKLNANAHRNKNSQKNKLTLSASKPNERVIESGSVINDKSLLERLKREEEEDDEDDEIVVVDDVDSSKTEESQETDLAQPRDEEFTGAKSLSEKDALALLPPIDGSVLDEECPEPPCTCRLKENQVTSGFSIGVDEEEDDEGEQPPPFEVVEDPACPAKEYFAKKYLIDDISTEKILRLNEACLPNVNGNWSLGTPRPEPPMENGLYTNVVPNIYERLDKDVKPFDSFKKYSVSEGDADSKPITSVKNSVIKTEGLDGDGNDGSIVGSSSNNNSNSDSVIKKTSDCDSGDDVVRTAGNQVFREWYECLDTPSYNGDTLRILPYCIVD